MESTAGFEESVNAFTVSKTGEKIYLDLATENVVIIRPLCKRGSVPLAGLWVHVFQHSNNYPVCSYAYKKLYKAEKKYELQLRVDGLNIVFDLESGRLILKGQHVLDWFVSRFQDLLIGYCSPPRDNAQELRDIYNTEQIEGLQAERAKIYKHYLEEWPIDALDRTAKVMEAGKRHSEIEYESVDPSEFLNGDLESLNPHADLLNSDDTHDQLERLIAGRVIQGCVLYRLWRSTLDLWFSDKDARVFVATPHIDSDRLTDICMLFMNHKLDASLDTFCVPISNVRGRFTDVRTAAIKRFPARDQVFIEYKIYGSIVYPITDFTTSFIAMVKEGQAHILQTNTSFDRQSLLTSSGVTAQFNVMGEDQFMKCYLDPVLS